MTASLQPPLSAESRSKLWWCTGLYELPLPSWEEQGADRLFASYGRSRATPRGPKRIWICCALGFLHRSVCSEWLLVHSIASPSCLGKQCLVLISALPVDSHPSQFLGSAVLPESLRQVHRGGNKTHPLRGSVLSGGECLVEGWVQHFSVDRAVGFAMTNQSIVRSPGCHRWS